jgi:signal transduction histidine kinase
LTCDRAGVYISPVELDPQTLLAALDEHGVAVAVLRQEQVVAANPAAARLGDLVALSRWAQGEPSLVRPDPEHAFEVRALSVGEAVVLVGRDVRDREQAREQLARSDEILSLAAHELKGPLHVLGMICHLLENRASRGEPLDPQTIDRLRRQVGRLNRLINQLLDASRAQEGRLELDLEEMDLADMVREELSVSDGGRRADVTARVPDTAPLRADRARLGEVVHQLVDNAIRFTPAGTPVRVSLEEERGGWRLTVTDEGPGIRPTDRDDLFKRTVRRDRRRGPQGLGLGLYIAAQVVRLQGGELRFEPTLPMGSTFHLWLPR